MNTLFGEPISEFTGEYRFLSNFYPAEVKLDGSSYYCVEVAYQAAKTLDLDTRNRIALMTPGQAKRFGSTLELREDWYEIRVDVMTQLVKQKFLNNEDLKQALADTYPRPLVEGNTWGDTFWGQCPVGKGKNILGVIIMSVREKIIKEG